MIAASLAAWINAQAEFSAPGIALTAFVDNPDLERSELVSPYALVSDLVEGPQELFVIGNAERKENPQLQVTFFATSFHQMRDLEIRFRRLIESATATDVGGLIHPGIDFKAFADLLRNAGDNLNYFADQPNWFASPTPIIYKNEDANGEPLVVAAGYTVDSTLGKITFSSANASSDKIRASYKIGVIDFNIVGVAHFQAAQDAGLANNPQRYAVAFDLETHFYIKKTANRHL